MEDTTDLNPFPRGRGQERQRPAPMIPTFKSGRWSTTAAETSRSSKDNPGSSGIHLSLHSCHPQMKAVVCSWQLNLEIASLLLLSYHLPPPPTRSVSPFLRMTFLLLPTAHLISCDSQIIHKPFYPRDKRLLN